MKKGLYTMAVTTYNAYYIPEARNNYSFDYKNIYTKTEMIFDKLRRLIFTPKGTDLKDKNYGTNIRNYIQRLSKNDILQAIANDINSSINRYIPEHVSNISVSVDWFKPNLFRKTIIDIKFVIDADEILIFSIYLYLTTGKLYIS